MVYFDIILGMNSLDPIILFWIVMPRYDLSYDECVKVILEGYASFESKKSYMHDTYSLHSRKNMIFLFGLCL